VLFLKYCFGLDRSHLSKRWVLFKIVCQADVTATLRAQAPDRLKEVAAGRAGRICGSSPTRIGCSSKTFFSTKIQLWKNYFVIKIKKL
jgi:hypothetical protein